MNEKKNNNIHEFPSTFAHAYQYIGYADQMRGTIDHDLYHNLLNYGLYRNIDMREIELNNGFDLIDSLKLCKLYYEKLDYISLDVHLSNWLIDRYSRRFLLLCGGANQFNHLPFDTYKKYLMEKIPSLELLEFYCSIDQLIDMLPNTINNHEAQKLLIIKSYLHFGVLPEIIMLGEIASIDIHNCFNENYGPSSVIDISTKHFPQMAGLLMKRIIGVKNERKVCCDPYYLKLTDPFLQSIIHDRLIQIDNQRTIHHDNKSHHIINTNLNYLNRIEDTINENF